MCRKRASDVISYRSPSPRPPSSRPSLSDTLRVVFNPWLVSKIADLPYSSQLLQRWHHVLHLLLPLGGSSSGNRVSVYNDGDDAFEAMWGAIERATRSVRMETYIFEPDAVGVRTLQLLQQAAERGVEVTLIYDSAGSSALLTQYELLAALQRSGATVVQFNPILSWPWRRRLLFRNHRKILVVDERIGFTGGMNVGAEYCGKRLGGTHEFRDTHLKVEGPAVTDLLRVFEDSYAEGLPNAPVPVWRTRSTYLRAQREKLARLGGGLTARARQLMRRMMRGRASLPPLHEPSLLRRDAVPTTSPSSPLSSSSSSPSSTASPSSISSSLPLAVVSSPASSASVSDTSPAPSAVSPSPSASSSASSSSAGSSVHTFWPSPAVEVASNVFVQVLKSNVWRNARLIQRALVITLLSSRYRAFITTPYFIPHSRLRRAMFTAVANGVDVRVLTSGRHLDVPWSRWASLHVYYLFLQQGIRVYELSNARMLHAKTATIDGVYATVGSFNLDRLSLLNLEVNLTLLEPDTASQLEQHFYTDLQNCSEVRLDQLKVRHWTERLLHFTCYHLALLIH